MIDIEKRVKEIAERYQKQSILKEFQDIINLSTLKIGFIGEYSAGKTSLINSILGTKLPIDITPTTKTICLIEPQKGLQGERYYRDDNGTQVEIDYVKFEEIVCGEKKEESVILQIPAENQIPEGCVFVDTPGINSPTPETELSSAYLSLMDGAVLCVKKEKGCLTREVLDFLLLPVLRPIHDRLLIAITFVNGPEDLEAAQTTKKYIQETLEQLSAEGKFLAKNIAEKIIFVGKEGVENRQKIVNCLNEYVLKRHQDICSQKKHEKLKQIAKDLLFLLEDDYNNTFFDDEKLTQEQLKIEANIQQLKQQEEIKQEKRMQLENELANELKLIIEAHSNGFAQENEQAVQLEIEIIIEEIRVACQGRVNQYLKECVIPQHITGNLANSVALKAKRIQQCGDITTDLITTTLAAAASVGIGGATSAAGNALEAGAGGAAGGVITAASNVDKVAKTAPTAAKVAKTAEAAKEVSKWGKFVGFLGKACKVIKEAFPTEQIKHLVLPMIKEAQLRNFLLANRFQIVRNVMKQIEQPYEIQILEPIRGALQEKKAALEKIIQARRENLTDFATTQDNLQKDIDALKSLIDQ